MKQVDKALYTLASNSPVMGLFLANLEVHESKEEYAPMWTNGRSILYNEKLMENVIEENDLKEPEIQYMVAHELMHIISGHCLDNPNLCKDEFANIAKDVAIHKTVSDIVSQGFKNVDEEKIKETYETLNAIEPKNLSTNASWEKNYVDLEKQDVFQLNNNSDNSGGNNQSNNHAWNNNPPPPQEQNNNGNGNDQSQQQPQGAMSQSELDDLNDKVAAQAAVMDPEALKDAAGLLGGKFKEAYERLTYTPVNWGSVVGQSMPSNMEDYSYQRPRQFGRILLPRITKQDGVSIVALVDTSGSMSDDNVKDGLRGLLGWMSTMPGSVLHVVQFDAGILNITKDITSANIHEYSGNITREGYGGTSLNGVFDKLKEDPDLANPDACIIVTDGYLNTSPIKEGGDIDTDYSKKMFWALTRDGYREPDSPGKQIVF